MRLGLIRHFKVEQDFPRGWPTAAELAGWLARYQEAAVCPVPVDLGGVAWAGCLCSDLPRAVVTAETIFAGAIQQTELLREMEVAPFRTGRLRLPVLAWRWSLQLAWLTGHRSQRAPRDDLQRRVVAMADLLEARGQDLLVVSHAGLMIYLARELRRRGFHGPRFRLAENAKLYLFERPPPL